MLKVRCITCGGRVLWVEHASEGILQVGTCEKCVSARVDVAVGGMMVSLRQLLVMAEDMMRGGKKE